MVKSSKSEIGIYLEGGLGSAKVALKQMVSRGQSRPTDGV